MNGMLEEPEPIFSPKRMPYTGRDNIAGLNALKSEEKCAYCGMILQISAMSVSAYARHYDGVCIEDV